MSIQLPFQTPKRRESDMAAKIRVEGIEHRNKQNNENPYLFTRSNYRTAHRADRQDGGKLWFVPGGEKEKIKTPFATKTLTKRRAQSKFAGQMRKVSQRQAALERRKRQKRRRWGR